MGAWGTSQTKVVSRPSPPPPPPSVFGHISFRSDWELVKVDFRPWFSRQCSEEDYSSWDLTNLQVGLAARWGWAPRRAPSARQSPRPAGPRASLRCPALLRGALAPSGA